MKRSADEALGAADPPPTADPPPPMAASSSSAEPSGASGRYVFVTAFDRPGEMVEVDTEILGETQPRLLSLIKYEKPHVDAHGNRFWRSGMHQALLYSFLTSLRLNRLSVGRGTTAEEVLATFEHEGVVVAPPEDHPSHFPRLRAPRGGVHEKKLGDLAVRPYLVKLAEQVATALVRWPRLEDTLRIARKSGSKRKASSTSRVWVSFETRPMDSRPAADDWRVAVTSNYEHWLRHLLTFVGIARFRLIKSGELANEYTPEHFRKLTGSISHAMLGSFWFVPEDRMKRNAEQEGMYRRAQSWATKIRERVMAPTQDPDKDAVDFSFEIVKFCTECMEKLPPLCLDLSDECCDADGHSPERDLLAAALKERRVEVVRWSTYKLSDAAYRQPLTFPGLHENACVGPKVLLDFSEI